jgi:flagellin
MTAINTNVNSLVTQGALRKNQADMSTSMTRLSTGLRINTAADDAAGMAIASRMTAQINGLNQAVRNANDAVSMIQTADGATVEISNMFQRMRELAVQSLNGTNTADDRSALDTEFQALLSEIERVADNTQWNGRNVLDGSVDGTATFVTFQIGANSSQSVTLAFGDFQTATGTDSVYEADISTMDITDETNAGTALTTLTSAINKVNAKRAEFGSTVNRLGYAIDNLSNVALNAEASRSRVQDADYGQETSELARTQIIQQAGTAMLAQANALPQTVLALLK